MRSSVVLDRLLVAALVALTGVLLSTPAAAQAPAGPFADRNSSQSVAADAYRIGPEDVLQIGVWKNEALSKTVPVRPDGKISLPLVNDVQAAGLTATELREVLTKKLAEYMPSPEVSVIVSDIRSLKVSVIGEVARPGRYELKSWATVLDVLALAGGFTQFASRSKIVVLRPEGSAVKRILFNYNKVSAAEQDNFYIRNGDVILVP
jgi:polysaccharide export outer membrane protein